MLQQHKIASVIGAVGALIVGAHILMGPDVVAVPVALFGLVLLGSSGLVFFVARRRDARADDLA